MKLKNIALTALMGFTLLSCNTSHAIHPKLAFAQSIGFEKIQVTEDDVQNVDTVLSAINFATKDESKRINGLKLKVVDTGADLVIGGAVSDFHVSEIWHPPYASARTYTDKYIEKDWYDDKNEKHTMTISAIKSEISKNYGRFTFNAYAKGNLYVKDGRTGEVLFSFGDSSTDDKPMDAYRNVLKKFYKAFEKNVKESRKKLK